VNLFVYMFVFRLLLNARFGDAGPQETAIFMLAGILVWAAFAEALTRSTNCLVENSNLIRKIVFPSEILPVNLTLSSVVNMLIGMPIVVVGVMVIVRNPLGPPMVLIPVLLVAQVLFAVGLGYVFATCNALWRDTYHLVGVGVQVWMFATPIFYPPLLVELAPMPGTSDLVFPGVPLTFAWMLEINPMHWLIQSWRQVLLWGAWPDWSMFLRFVAVSVVVFFAGAAFFQRHKRSFADLL
jgi:ABC-type polysaccharide/polyol phosphate export permease